MSLLVLKQRKVLFLRFRCNLREFMNTGLLVFDVLKTFKQLQVFSVKQLLPIHNISYDELTI